MKLFLRNDLFKADPPAPGSSPSAGASASGAPSAGAPAGGGPPKGFQPCPYGGGAECEKHGGNGAQNHKDGYVHQLDQGKGSKPSKNQDADPEKPGKQEPESKDPLKAGQPDKPAEKKPDIDEAKKLLEEKDTLSDTSPDKPGEKDSDNLSDKTLVDKEANPLARAREEARQGAKAQVYHEAAKEKDRTQSDSPPPSPFDLNSESHAATSPMDHYHAAHMAEKLGDAKMAQFHRQQAREKISAVNDGQALAELSNELREAGFEEDAKFHDLERKNRIKQGASQIGDLAREMRADPTRGHGKKDSFAEKLAKQKARRARAAAAAQGNQQQGNQPLDQTQADSQEAVDERSKNDTQVDTDHEDTLAGENALTGKDAQTAADSTQDGVEATQADSPEAQNEVASGDTLVDDNAEDTQVGANLNVVRDAVDRVKEKIRNKPENVEKEQKRQIHARIEESQKKGQERAKAEFSRKQQEFEEAHQAWKQKNKDNEKKLKDYEAAHVNHKQELERIKDRLQAVTAGKPVKDDKEERKIQKQLDSHKQKMQEHAAAKPTDAHIKNAQKKLEALKNAAPAKPTNEADLKKYEKKVQAHNKKVQSLKAQISTMKSEHRNKLEEHKKKGAELKKKQAELTTKHKSAKAAAAEQHKKKLADWNKKKESIKAELQKKKEEKLPEKPQLSTDKEPEPSVKKPSSDEEKMAHEDHTRGASKLADELESHLRNNPNLTPEIRERLHKLHEQAVYQANIAHNPSKEDQAQMKAAVQRAKEAGAGEHYDKVAQKEQAAKEKAQAKEQAKQEKEKAKQEKEKAKQEKIQKENTPQKPQTAVEEAEMYEHKKNYYEKAELLQEYLDGDAEMDDEERKHLQEAIDKYRENGDRDTLPTKAERAELKKLDKVTSRHTKAAESQNKEGGGSGSTAPANKRSSGSTLAGIMSGAMRAWNTGGAIGRKLGAAAASPYGGAGGLVSVVDYAGRGALSTGHFLLKDRKFGSKPEYDHKEGDKGQKEINAIANKRAKAK